MFVSSVIVTAIQNDRTWKKDIMKCFFFCSISAKFHVRAAANHLQVVINICSALKYTAAFRRTKKCHEQKFTDPKSGVAVHFSKKKSSKLKTLTKHFGVITKTRFA